MEAPMIDPRDIHSLTEFQRDAKGFLRRLRRSGRPEVLTVNGKSAVVVQDAVAYTAMVRLLEHAQTIEAVRVGLEQADAGKLAPLQEVAREMRSKYGQNRRRRRSA
jgi:predicted transcriptional regulator